MESLTIKRSHYLYLKLFGKTDTQEYKKILQKSNDELINYKNSKMLLDLIDVDFSGRISRKKVVFAMILFDVLKLNQKKQIAVLVKQNYFDKTVKKYADIRNKDLEVFHSEDDAVAWLMKQKQEPFKEKVLN